MQATAKTLFALTVAALALPFTGAQAQTFESASGQARVKLQSALTELAQTREAIATDKIPLIRAVTSLEDDVRQQSTELDRLRRLRDNSDLGLNRLREQVGAIKAQNEYAAGLLDEFVRSGGTLVTLNRASMFAIEELHLPVRNVVLGIPREEYFQSGSIVELDVDPSHPVMSGMQGRANVVVGQSPVFTTEDGFEGAILAKYPARGSPLVSGYLLGEEHLQGYAAALDVRHGDGRVVLLGMRPQWRGQPFGNFRILFNAALYSSEVAALTPANDDFWSPPEPREEEGEKAGSEGR